MNRRPRLAALALGLALALSSGCVTYLASNERLRRSDPSRGYRIRQLASPERSGELLLLLAFSGGGTRAAAFAYGALEELAQTWAWVGGRRRRLLDEVDAVSGVSGGSFTAAYFALHGDRIFEDFEPRFLRRNVQLRMLSQLLLPQNWVRLFSTYFERTELAAEYFDRELFDGATFGDLEGRAGAPWLLINATDLSIGDRFGFTQEQFDLICSDLSRFKIARAVTASSAVPLLLSAVILRNHAGRCDYEPPAWLEAALRDPGGSTRRAARARRVASYFDSERRRFIHLLDGGISDNLGLRGPLDSLFERIDPEAPVEIAGHASVREVAIVVVDAATQPAGRFDAVDYAPPLAAVLDAVTSVQLNRYSFETLELVRATLGRAVEQLSTPERPVHFRLIDLSFDAVADPAARAALNQIPTRLSLSAESVDRLRGAAREALRRSPAFHELLAALRAASPHGATEPAAVHEDPAAIR